MGQAVNRAQIGFTPLTNGGTLVSPLSALGTYNSADIPCGSLTEIAMDISVTTLTGTAPTLTFSISRKGTDGVYYPIYTGAAISATGVQSVSLGAGLGASPSVSFGNLIRITCVAGGTALTNAVYTLSLIGK